MKAEIRYALREVPHPYDAAQRSAGRRAMCFVKEVVTASGHLSSVDVVAMFNFDSEALLFAEHVAATGLDGKLVHIDKSLKDFMKTCRRLKADSPSRETP